MPQLDPKVGIPAVQLVHPETGREELLDLYLEVYKLHRLPSSPPGEPAIFEGRYHLPSLATHWRRKALLTPKDSLIPKAFTHPKADHLNGRGKVCWTEA